MSGALQSRRPSQKSCGNIDKLIAQSTKKLLTADSSAVGATPAKATPEKSEKAKKEQ